MACESGCHAGGREFDSGRINTQGLKITEEKMLIFFLSVQARVAQVTNRHRRLISYHNPARKHYRRQNMDESGQGSRETIMLVGTR